MVSDFFNTVDTMVSHIQYGPPLTDKACVVVEEHIFTVSICFFVGKECSTRLQLTYCDWEAFQHAS